MPPEAESVVNLCVSVIMMIESVEWLLCLVCYDILYMICCISSVSASGEVRGLYHRDIIKSSTK